MGGNETVSRTSPREARSEASRLFAQGWQVFELPDGLRDRQTFLQALNHRSVPLDPPMDSIRKWDALIDSLEGGLIQLVGERVALVWPDPHLMQAESPHEFDDLMSVLNAVAQDAANWDGEDSPLELRLTVGDR